MTRGRLALLGAVALVAVGAGCASVSGNDAAAVVDGVEIARSDFEVVLREFDQANRAEAEAAGAAPTAPGESTTTSSTLVGAVDGDTGRGALTAMVRGQALQSFLASFDEAVTEEELAAEQANEPAWFADLPTDVRTLISGLGASSAALSRVGAGNAQEDYERSPADAGALCLRIIVVETEDDAQAVAEELAAGGDFAELAAEHSIIPGAADNGGVQTDPQTGSECLATSSVQAGNPLVDAASELGAGEVSAPIEAAIDANGTMGWYLIAARPYDEVADAVDALWGPVAFERYLGAVDVSVDARYGRWDAETSSIVALS